MVSFTLFPSNRSFILAMVLGIFLEPCQPASVHIENLARIFVEFYQNTLFWCNLSSSLWSTSYQWLYHHDSDLLDSCSLRDLSRCLLLEVIAQEFSSFRAVRWGRLVASGSLPISVPCLIILPQASVSPLLDQPNRQLIKNTSTVAIISGDLMFVTKSWSALNGNHIPAFLVLPCSYFLLPVGPVARKMEQANKKPIHSRRLLWNPF